MRTIILCIIESQQASATEDTDAAIKQLLNYLTAYTDYGIIYSASSMVLADHSDAGFHNKTKGRRQAGAHIFLSGNDPEPRWNVPVFTIAQIIKFFMTPAAET